MSAPEAARSAGPGSMSTVATTGNGTRSGGSDHAGRRTSHDDSM